MASLLGRFAAPLVARADMEAAVGGAHARKTGRSWWALRFLDGRVLHEWDLDPASPTRHMDWPRLAMLGQLRNLQALRLYCPNGRMAELGGEGDQTGRLFQFKVAVRYTGTGEGAPGRDILAHVAGQVVGLDGQCVLFAWRPRPEPRRPRVDHFVNARPGMLSDAYDAWLANYRAWQQSGGGELVGPLEDNVYALRYENVGRLSADHLGLADGEGR